MTDTITLRLPGGGTFAASRGAVRPQHFAARRAAVQPAREPEGYDPSWLGPGERRRIAAGKALRARR